MYLVINKCVTAVKVSNFSGHYLRNRSTLDIGVLGYIGIVSHKERPPEVWHIPPGTLCICTLSLTSTLDDGRRLSHATAALPPPSRPGKTANIHRTGGWVGPRYGLDGEAENSPPTGIRSPVYPGPQ